MPSVRVPHKALVGLTDRGNRRVGVADARRARSRRPSCWDSPRTRKFAAGYEAVLMAAINEWL
jgi:hypothetical protein